MGQKGNPGKPATLTFLLATPGRLINRSVIAISDSLRPADDSDTVGHLYNPFAQEAAAARPIILTTVIAITKNAEEWP